MAPAHHYDEGHRKQFLGGNLARGDNASESNEDVFQTPGFVVTFPLERTVVKTGDDFADQVAGDAQGADYYGVSVVTEDDGFSVLDLEGSARFSGDIADFIDNKNLQF
jgi:hypothetical protein